jgi:hypothetical protein
MIMIFFKIFGSKLYMDGSILDFNMPSGDYSVQIDLIDIETDDVVSTVNHTVFVDPCLCLPPPPPPTTTTTTTTTTTSTTLPPTTTTTIPPTTTTTTTEEPCPPCEVLTIQFKTFTIPDSLTVFDENDNIIMSTGPISTGSEFITIILNNLPCGFYVCVDAPDSGTAWELIITGCLEIDTSGGQNIGGLAYCYQGYYSTATTTIPPTSTTIPPSGTTTLSPTTTTTTLSPTTTTTTTTEEPINGLYFTNSSFDGDWNNTANWSEDSLGNIPANRLPNTNEDAVILSSVSNNGGPEPTIENLFARASISISLSVTNSAIFTEFAFLNSGAILTTNTVSFEGNFTYNLGTVNGNATFRDNAYNYTTVNGNAVFNNTSVHWFGATINGDATFNDDSNNYGIVTGNTTCNTTGSCI